MPDTPIRLHVQCMDAFGKYLCDQMVLLMDIYEDPSIDSKSFQGQYLEPLSKKLEGYVLRNVKFSGSYMLGQNKEVTAITKDRSNQFTEEILNQVIKSLDIVKGRYGGEVGSLKPNTERLLVCEKVAAVIGAGVYHPLSTTLDLFKEYDFSAEKIPRTFTTFFLQAARSKMKNLTTFKLRSIPEDRLIVSLVLKNMQKLMVFSYRNYCDDYTISSLVRYCKNLTDLDVQNSREVTDKSVASLLSFRDLKSLQMTGTGLSSKGVTEIIQGFPDVQKSCCIADGPGPSTKHEEQLHRDHMTCLGMDLLLSDVQPVVDKFVNLKTLQLTLNKCVSLSPLKKLCSLSELDIGVDVNSPEFSYFNFTPVMNSIITLGGMLRKLVLREVNINWSDMEFVVMRCFLLQHIGLQFKCPQPFLSFTNRNDITKNGSCNCDFLSCLVSYFHRIPSWNLSGLVWCSDLIINFIILRVKKHELKTMKVNEYDMTFDGNHVSITSMFGAHLSVVFLDFEQILKEIFFNAGQLVIRLRFKTFNEMIF